MEKKITLQEFLKLPHEQRIDAYQYMSDHDRFLWRTQYEPIGGRVVGHSKATQKEKEEARSHLKEILKKRGINID